MHNRDIRSEDIGTELDRLRQIEAERPLNPAELIQRGRCLQVFDGANDSLREAENAFLRAVELDRENAIAPIELAWFYLNVRDDAQRARRWFLEALDTIQMAGTEAVIGYARCLAELESHAAAIEALTQCSLVDKERIEGELRDLRG